MSTFWDDPPPVVKIHNFFFFFRMNPSLREAFKKNNDETYGKFHILGGGQRGVIFHML